MPPPDILQLSTCLDDLSNSGFWVQCSPLMDGHFCQRIWQPLKTFPLHRAMENTRARVSSYSRWPKSFLSSWKYWLKFCCVPLSLSLEESNKIMSYKYKKITALFQGQAFMKSSLLRITKLILEINMVALDLFICTYLPYYNIFSNSMLGFCIFFFE